MYETLRKSILSCKLLEIIFPSDEICGKAFVTVAICLLTKIFVLTQLLAVLFASLFSSLKYKKARTTESVATKFYVIKSTRE